MYRYNTIRISATGSIESRFFPYHINAEIIMLDSKQSTLDTDIIKGILSKNLNLKNGSLENIARVLSLRLSRYVFKAYPYVLTIKVKVLCNEDGISSEMELSEEELVIEQNNGGL